MDILELETTMWEAAKARNSDAFLKVVDKNAVMVCGGYRCSGAEYAEIIKDFDVAEYEITGFEQTAAAENLRQVHYVIRTEVSCAENSDLAGSFHITSTWQKTDGEWKLIFNMDSRIFG